MDSFNFSAQYRCPDGTWLVNWPVVYRIVEQYYHAVLRCSHSRAVPVQLTWREEFISGKLQELYVPHEWIKAQANSSTVSYVSSLREGMQKGRFKGKSLHDRLACTQENAHVSVQGFQAKMREVNAANLSQVRNKEAFWGRGVERARKTRDASVDSLVFLGAVYFPPAKHGLRALGSVAKAGLHYVQDGKALDACVIDASSELLLISADVLLKKSPGGKRVYSAFVNLSKDTYLGLLEGEPLSEALGTAVVKEGASQGLESLSNAIGIEEWLQSKAMPVAIGVKEWDSSVKMGKESLAKHLTDAAHKTVVDPAARAVIAAGVGPSVAHAPTQPYRVAATTANVNGIELKRAIRRVA